ncbi:hypothetical protein GCM10023192_22540 [Amycolatopsis samaneae]
MSGVAASPGRSGNGFSGNGLSESGFSAAGLSDSALSGKGLSGKGFSGSGFSGSGFSGKGFSGSGFSGSGLSESDLSDRDPWSLVRTSRRDSGPSELTDLRVSSPGFEPAPSSLPRRMSASDDRSGRSVRGERAGSGGGPEEEDRESREPASAVAVCRVSGCACVLDCGPRPTVSGCLPADVSTRGPSELVFGFDEPGCGPPDRDWLFGPDSDGFGRWFDCGSRGGGVPESPCVVTRCSV